MRLWHKDLIPYLPEKQLMKLWKDCVKIAKEESGKPEGATIWLCSCYPIEHFVRYAILVKNEMFRRHDYTTAEVRDIYLDARNFHKLAPSFDDVFKVSTMDLFCFWHTKRYLKQCLYILEERFDCGKISTKDWRTIVRAFPEFNLEM